MKFTCQMSDSIRVEKFKQLDKLVDHLKSQTDQFRHTDMKFEVFSPKASTEGPSKKVCLSNCLGKSKHYISCLEIFSQSVPQVCRTRKDHVSKLR